MSPKTIRQSILLLTIISLGTLVVSRTAAQDQQPKKESATATKPKPTENKSDDPPPRRALSPSEILKELRKDAASTPKPITPPSRTATTVQRVNPRQRNLINPIARKLLPDGSRLVDRPGRLTREGDYFTFSFESRTQGEPELPIRLLPNRLLEDMEIVAEGGTRPVVFVVSGEVTEYHGVNYLLIQKLLVRPQLGNLQ